MKNLSKFLILVLCVFLCVPCFYACNNKNNVESAKSEQHIYNLDVILDDDNKKLEITQNLEFNNFSNKSLNELKFNIYPNAYRSDAKYKIAPDYLEETYPNGKSYGSIEINEVSETVAVANYEICGDDKNILKIKLYNELKPNQKIGLKFSYVINLANVRHRLGYADNVFTLANFYISPCLLNKDGTFFENHYYDYGDPFAENLSEFNVNFTCAKTYKVFSSGEVENQKLNLGNTKTLNLTSELTRSFIIVASKSLKELSANAGDTKITYAYLTDEKPKSSLNTAVDAFKVFTNTFGKTGKKQVTVVEAPYCFGGMEFSNLVLVTTSALNEHENFESIIVHELAHQWWYDIVGNNQVTNPLLDESLTEFSTLYYYFKTQGLTTLRELAAKNLNSHILFLEVEKNVYDNVDESLNRALDNFKTGGEYAQIIYTRGSLMFYNLFELMGEKKFDKALKNYFAENMYKISEIDNLKNAFQKSSKINLKAFFNNWLSGNIEISQI